MQTTDHLNSVDIEVPDAVTGELRTITMPISVTASAFHLMQTVDSHTLRDFIWWIVSLSGRQQVADQVADLMIQALQETKANYEKIWSNPEEMALHYTYTLLRHRDISREEAAEIASKILGTTISTNTWRMRVDRWIDSKGLPKVGIRKRQSSKSTSGEDAYAQNINSNT
jgi:hypothetical protein